MKTKFRFYACAVFALALVASCKEDENPKVEESPFFIFFDQPAITIDTTPVAASSWEYGFVFNPLADGKITKLGVKLPVAGDFTVRLWDLSGVTPVVLRDQKITSATVHVPAFVDIAPVSVPKNAQLGITVLANSFYRLQKKDASAFSFPVVTDNISILSFNEEMRDSSLTTFPQTPNTTRVAPCVNVVFVAD